MYTDSYGLLQWNGTMRSRSLIAGVGGGYIEFSLTSECVDGKKSTVEVLALGPGFGGGFDIAETRADISFEDHRDVIDPYIFKGGFGAISAGFIIGPLGKQIGKIRLGDAFSRDSADLRGLDVGVSALIGSSNVMDAKSETCGCEK